MGVRTKPALLEDSRLRNLNIAGKRGSLDATGLAEMRQGKAARVWQGPYMGDQLSVDHVIPIADGPELGNVIANLELMPQRMSAGKHDQIGSRQRALAKTLADAGLLGKRGLNAVQSGL